MSKIVYTERVLIVLNRDGTMKGAAQYPLTTWEDPEIPDKQGDAQPIDAATLAAILPGTAALTAQVSTLIAERDAIDRARVVAVHERDAPAAQVAALNQSKPPP